MATVKQVLAAISQDGTLGPNQKRFVTEAVQRADAWINLNAPKKPRKITNAKGLMSLSDWEGINGTLSTKHIVKWIDDHKLDLKAVYEMIFEFRQEMFAKGKEYADFKAAFQTYLTKGWLSKTTTSCLAENNRSEAGTTVHSRGVSL